MNHLNQDQNAGDGAEQNQAGRDIYVIKNTYTAQGRQEQANSGYHLPHRPWLLVGRTKLLVENIARLVATGSGPAMLVLHGWPGVGKSTLIAALAHHEALRQEYPDGVLWASLGREPDQHSICSAWGYALGTDYPLHSDSLDHTRAHLAGLVIEKRVVLLLDDVWSPDHIRPLLIAGERGGTVVTTRELSVAHSIAPTPTAAMRIPVLARVHSYELFGVLAPSVIATHRKACHALVDKLEDLPLSIQVAARLVESEARQGLAVAPLLRDMTINPSTILEAAAPFDINGFVSQATPTVAGVLMRSVDRLSPQTRERFTYLAAFESKPAWYDIPHFARLWATEDPIPTVKELVGRGLLEPLGDGRFWMHDLLVTLARFLCL